MQACSGSLCAKFHTLSFINNLEKSGVVSVGFSSFLVNLSLLASVILHMICYRAFSLRSGLINTCSFFETNMMNHVLQLLTELLLGKQCSDGPASINVHFGMTIELLRPGLFKMRHSLRTVCI